jgi:hypothetical protein
LSREFHTTGDLSDSLSLDEERKIIEASRQVAKAFLFYLRFYLR